MSFLSFIQIIGESPSGKALGSGSSIRGFESLLPSHKVELTTFAHFMASQIILMGKLKLDLHPIFNQGKSISKELGHVINEAVEKKIKLVEIIPGKGSGQLRRKVIRFLDQPHIKAKYHRIEIDEKNHGRIFVHFKNR